MNRIVEVAAEYDPGEVHPDGLFWYNPRKLVKYAPDIPLWLIYGMRRIGKTFFGTWLAIELYRRYGWTTAWVRNYKVEFEDPQFRSSFLNAPIRMRWVDDTWQMTDKGVLDGEGHTVIEFFSLSTASNVRGNEHPDCHLIYMDEASREDRKVVKRAHIMFMSLMQTLLSGKPDCLAIVTSNRVSATDALLVGFKVYPNPKYDVTKVGKALAIETCKKGDYHKAINENDPFLALYQQGGYGDYANDDEDDMMALIYDSLPKNAKLSDEFYVIDGTIYGSWTVGSLRYFDVYRGSTFPRDSYFFTPNITECTDKVYLIPSLFKNILKNQIDMGCCRFKSPNVMMPIVNICYAVAV